ncbi:hypothetical protein G9Q84_08955 [Pseudomonas sp. P7]|uniref:hypothetical protein n=1 Tax=Pseudomonas TaxID=286 RepID=UPI0015EC1201|nr:MULTISPECIES: hypothetical protein [Pseudomonas]MBA2923019.1 hypothetical protein [Pseudomonas sivasensis]MCF5141194.1 hypothetical protein [Pseudomonas sp. PA-6-3C]MCF5149747.1 hypothetical protein [Pseudomonas sp. PA-6-3F]MCF5157943.1 hypothetical protein [Pseudomonas sp. PA-6-2E]MCF5174183.1 hypothetical protein [Pseudomonas sp. PA-6-1D]
MFKAMHPTLSEAITINDYIHLKRSKPSTGPARCPACNQPLSEKAVNDPDPAVKAHFAHVRNPKAPKCPIKAEGAIRYSVLTANFPDTQAAADLRSSFFKNWTYHWHQFKKYVRTADIKDFTSALREIDNNGVWKYQNIQEHEVIIAMLATRDFKPTKNSDGKVLRSRWVRFWFRSHVTSLQQFWNIGAGQKDLIRAEYDLSERATKIKEDKFLDFKVVTVDSTFLSNQDFSEAPRFVHVVMSERFPNMVAPPEPLEEKK